MKKVLDFCNITGESVKEYEGERNYIATGDVVDNKIISFENQRIVKTVQQRYTMFAFLRS